jgi:hypothetical protein
MFELSLEYDINLSRNRLLPLPLGILDALVRVSPNIRTAEILLLRLVQFFQIDQRSGADPRTPLEVSRLDLGPHGLGLFHCKMKERGGESTIFRQTDRRVWCNFSSTRHGRR